ncbi:MAG: low specificity L-threonine aldolase [Opitutales bacterium]|nr:low specificity L-threonine aldolase [Opitutales bacterium]
MQYQKRTFASDNYAGICPEAWQAMQSANEVHVPAYGADTYTEKACNMIRELFETDCEVFFTFNGTASNSLSLASMCRSYHSIICHDLAHIETDECGAIEFFSGGTKLLTVGGENGKVDPAQIEHMVHRRNDIHYPKPRVLSLTQATEVGTIYSVEEIRELGALTHGLGLKVHMDGARFANAIAALKCAPKDITWKAGVDVLCFGGTKNGLAVGEAIVFFNTELAREFDYRCKQAGQLASKMRFLAAPWLGMLKTGAWLKNAQTANERAALLESKLREIEAVEIAYPRQVNSVFAKMHQQLVEALFERGWRFYDFIAAGGARLMCSWDTTEEDVLQFAADVAELAPQFGKA